MIPAFLIRETQTRLKGFEMALPKLLDTLKGHIRDVPDFPKPGILFKDITPLLAAPKGLATVVEALAARYAGKGVDRVVAMESRGFIFGAPLAMRLGAGFVPVRKPGKLPYKTERVTYALEYGTDALEMHVDAIDKGQRVLIVDDLLATGGTAGAVAELVRRAGGEVIELAFVIELDFLKGRERLAPAPVHALLHY
jgi:adenine phosphoribosyltransferase